jgi:hypothetical protein
MQALRARVRGVSPIPLLDAHECAAVARQRIRISVAKRMLVYCGASGRTGKPIALMRTRLTPVRSSPLMKSTAFTTSSIELPVNSSPKT